MAIAIAAATGSTRHRRGQGVVAISSSTPGAALADALPGAGRQRQRPAQLHQVRLLHHLSDQLAVGAPAPQPHRQPRRRAPI
jgi:hypothetical protein